MTPQKERRIILVSACLLGLPTRYDGTANPDPEVLHMAKDPDVLVIPICPEQLGGLPTPREPCHFVKGDGARVWAGKARVHGIQSCEDRTEFFLRGAKAVADLAQTLGVQEAYLKERSPSCGVHQVYIEGELRPGMGITTAVLKKLHIRVYPREGQRVKSSGEEKK